MRSYGLRGMGSGPEYVSVSGTKRGPDPVRVDVLYLRRPERPMYSAEKLKASELIFFKRKPSSNFITRLENIKSVELDLQNGYFPPNQLLIFMPVSVDTIIWIAQS